jgi:hypothetical protein
MRAADKDDTGITNRHFTLSNKHHKCKHEHYNFNSFSRNKYGGYKPI